MLPQFTFTPDSTSSHNSLFSTWFSEFPDVCNVQQFTNSPDFPNSQVLAMETALPYLHMLRQLREAYTEAWNSLCGGRLVVLIIMIMLMLIILSYCIIIMIFLPKITLTRNRFQCSYDDRYMSKTFKTSYDDYNDWNKNHDVEDHDHCHEIDIFSCSRGICPRLSRLQPAAFLRQFFHPGLVGVFLFVDSFRSVLSIF